MTVIIGTCQWRIQDFCEGDAAGVWSPIFFGRDDPTFYGRLLARIGVATIFRWWVRPGVDPGFLVGDDGGDEGPERGAVGAKRRSVEGVVSGEGRRGPSTVCGSGGIAPRKFLKFNLQICAF